MKKNIFLWMGAVMLILSSCSTNDSITESISLSKVSHSECANHSSRTRGEDKNPFASKLKLTYNKADQTITGEYINYILSCDYTDAGINIEQDADGTLVLNPWNKAENLVDCICNINIYFTIRNATMQNYHLVLNRRTVTVVDPDGSKHQETWTDYDGYISFKNQNVITIDLSSTEEIFKSLNKDDINTLQINNSDNDDTEKYSVTNNHFYIDKMPILENNCPRFIFHCGIEKSLELRELIIRIIGVKQDIGAFQVGETLQLNQFNASLKPIEECATTQYGATKGCIKLVNKKKVGDKDVLTFQIIDLAFEKGYTINGAVDFEYEGTVY
ncbi:MAG: hypothetical protein IKI06_06565 [Prevotella sp.]|nr:hypothetical protein [Prevotella sp.]